MSEMPDTNPELPQVSFSSFVVSLATTAMSHLGEGPSKELDLALARNTVDLLGLLRDKTKGNLEVEEARLLDTMLYELRMKYLEKSRG